VCELACALFASPALVYAQSAGNKAAAEALFEEGKALMQSGEYARACEKFAASRNLDEGTGTLLYLADCYERVGRTASAWAMFREAASIAGAQGQESRQKLAAERAKNLEPGLVRLSVVVAPTNESLLGFEVRNDGIPIPAAQFGSAIPVDPGDHRIEASAPGKRMYAESIRANKGNVRVEVPPLADIAHSTSSISGSAHSPDQLRAVNGSVAVTPTATKESVPAHGEARHNQGATLRGLSYVSGGIGLVAVGLGSYFGLSAISKNKESKDKCPSSPELCSEQGVSLRDDALAQARLSNIAFAAGGVALAAGLVLYLSAPTGASSEVALAPSLGLNHAQLSARGSF
jgi:hypothetical protein